MTFFNLETFLKTDQFNIFLLLNLAVYYMVLLYSYIFIYVKHLFLIIK